MDNSPHPVISTGQSAFTLVELLVVIAVIAILAALLFPTLNRTRSVAKQTQCLNNLRNWTLASLMYAGEADGWLPARGPEAKALIYPNIVGSGFRGLLEGYGLKQTSDFCPEGAVRPEDQTAYYSLYGGSMGYSYYAYLPITLATVPRPPQKITDATDQAGRMSLLFSDCDRMFSPVNPCHTNHPDPSKPVSQIPTELGWLVLYAGTPRGINNAYIDGHLEWIPFQRLDFTVFYVEGAYSYHWTK